MRRTLSLVVLVLAIFGSTAYARRPAPPPEVWDSKGWVMLGEQQVSGRVDRDKIVVGRHEGQFSKMTIVVLDSELEMLDFTINFGDRTTYAPKLAYFFREGQRTKAFDLPPSAKVISHIDLKYRNVPGGGRARVQVWGWKTGDNAPRPQPAVAPWDSRDWTMLGERTVQGGRRGDRDKISVGRDEGKFRKLMLVVLDSDLEMIELTVKFGRGAPFRPQVSQFFRENTRTRAIDLPGDNRIIKSIEFRYRNVPGGGRAKVQVWGK